MDGVATDPPLDSPTDDIAHDLSGGVERDPIRAWLHLAELSHTRLHGLNNDYVEETRWRKECIRMAVAMGATPQMIASQLGISRPQVVKLSK